MFLLLDGPVDEYFDNPQKMTGVLIISPQKVHVLLNCKMIIKPMVLIVEVPHNIKLREY
jgi:hypothetical protein